MFAFLWLMTVLGSPDGKKIKSKVNETTSLRFMAYYTDWSVYARNFVITDVKVEKLTHLLIGFADPRSGVVELGDKFADTEKLFGTNKGIFGSFPELRKRNPDLKIIISIGGWTWSTKLSDTASTDSSRKLFSESVGKFIKQYDFDGVDIDWEYPVANGDSGNVHRPEDADNYVLLLKKIRDVIGKNKLLSICGSPNPKDIKNFRLKEMSRIIDFINHMAYDYYGGWSNYTGPMGPLYNDDCKTPSKTCLVPAKDDKNNIISTSEVVEVYVKSGMPAHKINFGIALYGHSFSNVVEKNGNTIYQKFKGIPKGTWDDSSDPKYTGPTGIYDYTAIKAKLTAGFVRHQNDKRCIVWAFNSETKELISYEDKWSIKQKMDFVKKQKLGGVFTWELSNDREFELGDTIFENLQ